MAWQGLTAPLGTATPHTTSTPQHQLQLPASLCIHQQSHRVAACQRLEQHRTRSRCAALSTHMATTTSSKEGTWVSQQARDQLFGTAVEQPKPVEATVTGTIPDWVDGDLLANGGGDYKDMIHLFDGLALISKLSIRNGRVTASQRYVQSEQYKYMKKMGAMKWREFGTPLKSHNLLQAASQMVEMVGSIIGGQLTTDNASVTLTPLADGTLMAASETVPALYRIDPDTLETLNKIDLSGDNVKGPLLTAHYKMRQDGRTLVGFSHTVPAGGIHVYTQDTTTLKRREVAFIKDHTIDARWTHDFAITENHAIIVEPPLFFNFAAMIAGYSTEYLFLDWHPELKTRVHVVKLDGSGEVVSHTAPPFFLFHHVNAFEENGMIHVDFGGYKDPKIVNDLILKNMRKSPDSGGDISPSSLWRLSMPADATAGQELPFPRELLRDPSQHGSFCEFPCVNPNNRMKPYRYAYCLGAARPTNIGNALAKLDVHTGTAQLWHEDGSAPGECVFIPAPTATSEDDGVVLCAVMGADGKTFLVVLDAKSFTEIGRASLPFAFPNRFHGAYLPARNAPAGAHAA